MKTDDWIVHVQSCEKFEEIPKLTQEIYMCWCTYKCMHLHLPTHKRRINTQNTKNISNANIFTYRKED
jgi:hypothetical protein